MGPLPTNNTPTCLPDVEDGVIMAFRRTKPLQETTIMTLAPGKSLIERMLGMAYIASRCLF